ncbi:hypothetical protein PoB_005435700 [Plakobranchus ocellatus]|uniref:Uncharacterized protein n=1 Tax=Plakobranchus ocellatus TaxID=259542 RepID=A0AAV4C8K5_9GAST|nr:hypothetical protein PoB_005435700 [Plakobranchus ocellatus]
MSGNQVKPGTSPSEILLGGVGGTMDSALRSAGTTLRLWVRAPSPAPWLDRRPEKPRSLFVEDRLYPKLYIQIRDTFAIQPFEKSLLVQQSY